MTLVDVSRALSESVSRIRFAAPVHCVYNPLDYARGPHELYVTRYGGGPKEVLLLGMNPGPFGMVQTGVPFGDVTMVRDWLRVSAPVEKPQHEHAKRPVLGFDCLRSEVSGARLWGWARDRFGTPDRFFRRFFVANYCPLAFMEAGARIARRTSCRPQSSKRSRRSATRHCATSCGCCARGSSSASAASPSAAPASRWPASPSRSARFFIRAPRALSRIAAGPRRPNGNSLELGIDL